MTAMAQNSELTLFITHVETEGPLLKIWGQIDRNAATCIERMILPLSEKFAQGLGLPNPNYPLPLNTICCARFQNEGYYRAKICNLQPNGSVLVHFVDYGNFEVLPPTAIRLLDNIPGAVPLAGLAPLALDFILAHILPVNGIWESETVESIKQTLRYADLKGILHSVIASKRLLKLCYNNEDFGDLLVSKKLAVSVTLQDMFTARRQVAQQQQQFANSVRETRNVAQNPSDPGASYSPRNSNPSQEDWRNPQQRQMPPQNIPEALVFKSRVLDVGSVHNVFVSCVEDGPLKFAVQLQSTSQILELLMYEINHYPTSPLQEPPLPGSVCLGRYSPDKVLGRAVVMSVMEHKCKLYYVDYGHTEVLPYCDIFQLPPQYINPKVLSIRFTLSGLKDIVVNDDTKDYFKKLVTCKALVLQVRPPEGPPLIQYGDLYDNGTNIRDVIKETSSTVHLVNNGFLEPSKLKKGQKGIVHVSFVESTNKFFVQLDSKVESLNSIMACLAEHAKNAPQLDERSLRVGTPCCACYGEDKQWYRAQILNIKGNQVTVLYVDYGNQETVEASSLRKIHNNFVKHLESQAIRCCLNGFQSSTLNQEIANQFELLVLEKKLAVEVIDALPNGSIVELFDCSVDPMVNIASQLQISNASMRPGNLNSSINSQREAEQQLNSSRSPEAKFQSEERNTKWGKNSKPNTWGQDSRGGDWNSRGRNNGHEGKDHYEEKSRTKSVKDVENEQRQRENNRHEGEDRLHQKETRNNHFNRNDSSGGNRFERNEDSGPRRGRGNRFGSGGRSPREDNRFDKNNSKDDNWSDRDSDTSSRSSGRRGSRGPRGIKGRGDRGGRRGTDRKGSSGKWSDGESDKSSQKSNQSSGFRSRDRNPGNSSWKNAKTQPNKSGSWNSMSPTSPVKDTPRVQKLRIPPPNITVGAVKNVEVIYTDSPTDFYVQLCPDNLELDKLMEKISQKYSSGGTIVRKSDIHQEMSCIAQYSSDSKWYRAIIKSNNAENANVHFIDYGNSETVGHDKIKELQPEFAKLSAQAVHCKLFAAPKSAWSDNEIDEFSQAAEGISLEGEFLSQDNGLYEVLLKPVAENNSESEYVNKLFSGNTDLIQAKNDLKNKDKGRRNVRKAKEIRQYIPASEKWSDATFSSGFQVDVVVTWFVNPNNFYCQILSKQSEFRTMMNNIQESYVDQEPIRNALQIGAPVIAFFSDDGALYRAEIRELNKLRGHIVQYVDFGNCAMVDPSRIYPVEKRFASLSKQAMHCSLRNVSPTTGVDWSNANKHDIDKYFDADKYLCTFHGTKDGKYIISLSNNGKDIGDAMITAGLAVNPELNIDKIVVSKVTSAELNPTIDHTEILDLTIWNGQTIRTIISDVQGTAKFAIQLPRSIDSGKIGGEVKNPTTADQTVECYLLDVTPTPEIDETFKKSVEGKESIVNIKSANNQRFAVEVYDASGKKLKLIDSEVEDMISPICPMPVDNPTARVWVTHIENPESLWLQRSNDSDNIADLISSLYEYYSVSGTPLVPEKGKLCAAESQDKNWYRAMIENVKESNEVKVRFIDYGNSEEVSSAAIKTLEEQFYAPYKMAIEVSLLVSLKGSDEEREKILHENLDDKEFIATFYNVDNNWLVEFKDENDEKTISKKFSELNLVDKFKEIEPKEQEIPEMIVGNRYKVFLSHSDSPAQFWLQRNEEIKAIEAMQSSLQIEAPNFSPVTGIPEEGTLCAALYSADGMWYRAEVLDADEDITTVRFIDYGNTDIVDSNSNSIKELPQSWKSVKKYGLKSRLDLIPTGAEDWSTASCEMFEKMATESSSPMTALIIADSVPRRVELFVEDHSVGDTLVNEGHAILVHNAEDLIDEIIELELDPRSAFVSHVNSPSEFWVQEEKSVSDLEIMTDRFIVAEMFPKLDNVVEGTLCVAKFPDDEQWYRARVNSHTPAGTQVLYIDYGNSAVSTEVRAIPEDLAAIAPLSRKCCLQLPPGVKEWSDKACDKFIELAADGATIFLLDVIKDDETSVVSLTLDGVNVADELCDILPVIDERLPPLGEENSPNIVVSHVNSPSEFWTQAESSMSELEIMASRLIDAQSLLPLNIFDQGTICAAKFPEDKEWYRAKILSHGEAGTNVLYFDYGNSAIATELRILPEDVAKIPSLATRCTLALPKDVEAWSDEANAKFNEIVADGATMFQFEILDDNDPTLIALQYEGQDVVDLLKPLCEPKTLTEEIDTQIITESATNAPADSGIEGELKIAETIEKESQVPKEIHQINDTENAEKAQTDNSDVSEAQNPQIITISDDSCEIVEVEGDEDADVIEEVQTTTSLPNVSETDEQIPPTDVNILQTDEIPPADTNILQTDEIPSTDTDIPDKIPEPKVEPLSNDELIPKIEIAAEISEPLESQRETVSTEPAVNNPEVILPKVELEDSENLIDEPIQTTESDVPLAIDSQTDSVEIKKEPEAIEELTVDDIVGNMVKVASVEDEDVAKIVEDSAASEGEKTLIIGEVVEEYKKGSEDAVEDPEVISTPHKTPKMDKIVPGSISRGSLEEDIPSHVLGRRRSSCTDDRIVPGSINKGNDLTEAEIVDLLPSMENGSSISAGPGNDTEQSKEREPASVTVTPCKVQREEKIVPGSISRGESPTVELNRPTTPKTPHSEKLLAGVINLQENLDDFQEEEDEIIIVEVENNIPEQKTT